MSTRDDKLTKKHNSNTIQTVTKPTREKQPATKYVVVTLYDMLKHIE